MFNLEHTSGKTNAQLKEYDFEHKTHSTDTASSMHNCRKPAENWEPRTQCRDEITGSYELPFPQYWFTRLRVYTAPQIPIHSVAAYCLLLHMNSALYANSVT
jgi:hypothetical protein